MADPITPLTCDETFRRLDDWVDRELSPAEMKLVEAHLAICVACAREFGFNASLIAGVKQKLRRIDAAPDLLARIRSALEADTRSDPS